MTLAVSERTFQYAARREGVPYDARFRYLKKVNQVFEVTEEQMRFWTQWFTHLTKVQQCCVMWCRCKRLTLGR